MEKTKVNDKFQGKSNLACERAEEIWVLQASFAGVAEVAGPSKGPRHRPLVQKHHFCTVCCV